MRINFSKIHHWPKWSKWLLRIVGMFFGLILISWLTLSWYINYKKAHFIHQITEYFHEHMSGTLTIKDLEPSIIKTFPKLSIRLDEIVIYDSLYEDHGIKTLDLDHAYIQLNFFSLLTSHPKFDRILLSEGQINLFHWENDYTNMYLFKSDPKKKKKQNQDIEIQLFSLEKIHFDYVDEIKNKRHTIDINALNAKITPFKDSIGIYTDLNLFVHQLGFNLSRGVFLNNKNVMAQLNMSFDKPSKVLNISHQELVIEKDPIGINMKFYTGAQPVEYEFHFSSPSLQFKKGMSLLSNHISSKFEKIDIAKPVEVDAYLHGRFQYLDTPTVTVKVRLDDNTLLTPYGDLEQTNIKALFNNQVQPDLPKADYNSGIFIEEFEGIFEGVPIHGDHTIIYSLIHPHINTRLKSNFPVVQLNNLTGQTINFSKGNAEFDLNYSGPLIASDTFPRSLNGYIHVKNASLTYVPNNLNFQEGNISMTFEGEDVSFDHISLSSRKSKIDIKGHGKRFLNAYFLDPSQVVIQAQVNSQSIDLNEFKSIFTPQHQKTTASPSKERGQKFNDHLALVLAKSTFDAQLNVGEITYHQFKATNIKGKGSFKEFLIDLEELSFNHASGTLELSASLGMSHQNYIPVNIDAKISHVKVDELFYAFNNFGQEVITSKNLKGIFSAHLKTKLKVSEDLKLKENSVNGTLKFDLTKGAIIDFEPLVNVSKFIFKKRNLDQITFDKISNELSIRNGMIYIPSFDIASSAIKLTIDGVYGLQQGTDINLAIPLRNPQRDERRRSRGQDPKGPGFTVHLKAKQDKDGNIKLGWAPGGENKDQAIFSDEELKQYDDLEFNLGQ